MDDGQRRRLLIGGLLATATVRRAPAAPPVTKVDLTTIAPGSQRVVYWDFKPYFVRRRTPEQIASVRATKVASLADPAADESRVKRPEWIVVEALCTHAQCLPSQGPGPDGIGGWLCPCHGSEFDLSGRVIQGPALRNLRVPPHAFTAPNELTIGIDS